MSDKEIKKAHVEEIELEIPIEEDITSKEPNIKRRPRPKSKTTPNEPKSIFDDMMTSIKEGAKIGIEAVKGYKEEILSKKEEPPLVKPNSAIIDNDKSKKDEQQENAQTIEIEFADEQKNTEPKTPYKMHVPEKTYVQEAVQTERPRRKKSQLNKKRPSTSPSAKAESFIEIFENDEDKKPIFSDKDFRKFVGMASILLVLFGAVWYGFTYIIKDDIPKINSASTKDIPGPINPSELFASRVPQIIDLLGKPKSFGTVDASTNSFIEYEDSWFGLDTTTKIVYGPDKRAYFADISFKDLTMEKVYPEMVKHLGEPSSNDAETKEAVWYVDSSVYALNEEDQKAMLNIQIPLYDNVNAYPIAQGAIIIQKQGGYDLTGDGKNDVVVIIGEKENYMYREYTKLHMTIWDGENVFYTGFPADTDGGDKPKITYEDIDKDGVIDVSIDTQNIAIDNYNSFAVKEGAIVSIYASHEKTTN